MATIPDGRGPTQLVLAESANAVGRERIIDDGEVVSGFRM
jgi:hypothetical protein